MTSVCFSLKEMKHFAFELALYTFIVEFSFNSNYWEFMEKILEARFEVLAELIAEVKCLKYKTKIALAKMMKLNVLLNHPHDA